jgi:hypothetical protein
VADWTFGSNNLARLRALLASANFHQLTLASFQRRLSVANSYSSRERCLKEVLRVSAGLFLCVVGIKVFALGFQLDAKQVQFEFHTANGRADYLLKDKLGNVMKTRQGAGIETIRSPSARSFDIRSAIEVANVCNATPATTAAFEIREQF